MSRSGLKPGDWVIYRKQKMSDSPGPRAKHVVPAVAGEMYRYRVEKFWIVEEIGADGLITLRTRRLKRHITEPDDPRLRKARWWERWLYKERFLAVENATQGDEPE